MTDAARITIRMAFGPPESISLRLGIEGNCYQLGPTHRARWDPKCPISGRNRQRRVGRVPLFQPLPGATRVPFCLRRPHFLQKFERDCPLRLPASVHMLPASTFS